ncbi:uncharacterized protein LOC132329766 [Haemorhous mexicanus]|uniref:uncharacterized protein LOC132329766 n=1 Tax=Haemorhous mexicanus TaxID=30427 RepID=UPI0028BF1F82|nr:uncharacterized protein LOC132329766 [Haemorhous mexicanus]
MARRWCNTIAKVNAATTAGNQPLSLPRGLFLICRDRAWAGIPSRLIGGPCTLGRLSLFAPNLTQIINWKNKNVTADLARPKRDLQNLDPDCDSEIIHWSKPKGVAITLFLPWVSIAKSLGELAHLECWVAKQANLTSAALSDLLTDEEIIRKATLQNRAAIDFLLLLHNHRCEEFEGLCCLNLSSKAEDARTTIQKVQNMVQEIKKETSDWLGNILSRLGLSSWVGSILKTVFYVALVIIIVLVAASVLWGLLKRLLNKIVPPLDVNQEVCPGENSSSEEDRHSWFEDIQADSDSENNPPSTTL